MAYRIARADGEVVEGELAFGEMLRVPTADEQVDVQITPRRGVNVGVGKSERLQCTCRGGEVGIVLDARGRPFDPAAEEDPGRRRERNARWAEVMDACPARAWTAGGEARELPA